MAFLLISSGLGHFAAPDRFDKAIPAELPGDARTYTHVSGVAEVAIGALLLPRRTRRAGALAAAVFFILIAPAIVNGVRVASGKGVLPMVVATARLPLHVAMVSQAIKIARNA
jgi:uncharacterized membrane protein